MNSEIAAKCCVVLAVESQANSENEDHNTCNPSNFDSHLRISPWNDEFLHPERYLKTPPKRPNPGELRSRRRHYTIKENKLPSNNFNQFSDNSERSNKEFQKCNFQKSKSLLPESNQTNNPTLSRQSSVVRLPRIPMPRATSDVNTANPVSLIQLVHNFYSGSHKRTNSQKPKTKKPTPTKTPRSKKRHTRSSVVKRITFRGQA